MPDRPLIVGLDGTTRDRTCTRAVGCIVCAHGWQATGTTLVAMRSIVHALRGWPTPVGIAINTAETGFGERGECLNPKVARNLDTLGKQVLGFARMCAPDPAAPDLAEPAFEFTPAAGRLSSFNELRR